MEILFHFILGFITSFLGTIFPSMLSMTTVKISIRENQKKAISFALGVSFIVIGQVYVAITFSKLLLNNPTYLNTLQKVGAIVFIGLSIYFFNQVITSKKRKDIEKKRKIKGFVSGMFFSLLNMFAVPFYFGITSSFAMLDWYDFSLINNFCFALGSSLGTFTLLFLYSQLAKKVEKKIERLANQMDLVLGIITALIGVFNTIAFLR